MKIYTHDGLAVVSTAAEDQTISLWAGNRCPASEWADMIMCDRQRALDIAAGRPYYDYDAQCWRNERKQ